MQGRAPQSIKLNKPSHRGRVVVNHSGAWKTLSFKKYNLEAKGIPPVCGHLHPLLKVREEFRKIFFEMGSVATSKRGSGRGRGLRQRARVLVQARVRAWASGPGAGAGFGRMAAQPRSCSRSRFRAFSVPFSGSGSGYRALAVSCSALAHPFRMLAAVHTASPRCRPTTLWRARSGTLTRCSSRSSTRRATRTTPSS